MYPHKYGGPIRATISFTAKPRSAPAGDHSANLLSLTVVKVQIPLSPAIDLYLVYDEQRSFQHKLPGSTPGVESIRHLIQARGPRGLKGFFLAKREGEHGLRIFSDRILPAPGW